MIGRTEIDKIVGWRMMGANHVRQLFHAATLSVQTTDDIDRFRTVICLLPCGRIRHETFIISLMKPVDDSETVKTMANQVLRDVEAMVYPTIAAIKLPEGVTLTPGTNTLLIPAMIPPVFDHGVTLPTLPPWPVNGDTPIRWCACGCDGRGRTWSSSTEKVYLPEHGPVNALLMYPLGW